MIRGEFERDAPLLAGLVLFRHLSERRFVRILFLIDMGTDTTLTSPRDYQGAGLSYADFDGFPSALPSGIGRSISVRPYPPDSFSGTRRRVLWLRTLSSSTFPSLRARLLRRCWAVM